MLKPSLVAVALFTVVMIAGLSYTVTVGHRINKELDDVREIALRDILPKGGTAYIQFTSAADDCLFGRLMHKILRKSMAEEPTDPDDTFLVRFRTSRSHLLPASTSSAVGMIYWVEDPIQVSPSKYVVSCGWDAGGLSAARYRLEITLIHGQWTVTAEAIVSQP